MSNPTTPFGWQMPTNTDLVTDLPADFEVFGQAVATSMQDLLGGTTGQVLAKASNTDMDFVWSADAAGMTNPMTTTGDVIYSSPGSTPVRLGIGSTSQVLTVTGGVPVWATPPSSSPASAQARVETEQSTTSSSFTDLATVGPAVTLTTGTKVLVIVTAEMMNSTAVESNIASFAVSGATTVAAGTYDWYVRSMVGTANERVRFSAASRFGNYTAGSNTFTMKYRRTGGTASFGLREIIVMDLGS